MGKKDARLVGIENQVEINKDTQAEFLFQYQKAVLLTFVEQGVIDRLIGQFGKQLNIRHQHKVLDVESEKYDFHYPLTVLLRTVYVIYEEEFIAQLICLYLLNIMSK